MSQQINNRLEELFDELDDINWRLEYRENLLRESNKPNFPFPQDRAWYEERVREAREEVDRITAEMVESA